MNVLGIGLHNFHALTALARLRPLRLMTRRCPDMPRQASRRHRRPVLSQPHHSLRDEHTRQPSGAQGVTTRMKDKGKCGCCQSEHTKLPPPSIRCL